METEWKRSVGDSRIYALPLHQVCTRADGHMGDATFFKGSEANSWPTLPLPTFCLPPHRSQIACSNVSPSFYQTSPLSANSWGQWQEEASKMWEQPYIYVCVCLWMLMLYCGCRISCQPLLTWGPTVRHSQKNQYSFQWSWPTYSELLTAHWRLVCCSETVNL